MESGLKISYHKFPEDKHVLEQWIVAIRRDIGSNLKVRTHEGLFVLFKLSD